MMSAEKQRVFTFCNIEADYCPPSSVEIKNIWSYNSALPRAFMPGQINRYLNAKVADEGVLLALLLAARTTISKWSEFPNW
jgi:hypothetical protein